MEGSYGGVARLLHLRNVRLKIKIMVYMIKVKFKVRSKIYLPAKIRAKNVLSGQVVELESCYLCIYG